MLSILYTFIIICLSYRMIFLTVIGSMNLAKAKKCVMAIACSGVETVYHHAINKVLGTWAAMGFLEFRSERCMFDLLSTV